MRTTPQTELDAVVVGAGFAGIYALHKLRNELGLTVRAFDRADGVGGTWFWNRYPGAMSDSESFVYRYSFDEQMLQEWGWNNRYLDQPDILRYLEAVVEKHDLGRDIQLGTGVESAVFDDRGYWLITTDRGEVLTSRYLVTALGLLSQPVVPDLPGRDEFRGRIVHTGSWPSDLDLEGKRVGLIGTGSTGTQFVCAASKIADHLTVFQRTPQYSVPSGNGPVSEEYLAECRTRYPQIWEDVRNSLVGCGFPESTTAAMSVSPAERERVFEQNWQIGNGFRFMFGTFSDIVTDPDANEAACEFIRSKIRATVRDPETARKLCPTGYYAKRPVCNVDYYETFNRDNVELVSVQENPVVELTPDGLRTADGVEHPLDVLVLATGFDAVEGAYFHMDIRGRGGRSIREQWSDGPSSYLGVATADFPNMFMVLGPNSAFTNLPPGIETQVEWITELVRAAERREVATVEATPDAEAGWGDTCAEIAEASLFPRANSWIFGANVSGKKKQVRFFFAGLAQYRRILDEVAADGYAGFRLDGDRKAGSRAA